MNRVTLEGRTNVMHFFGSEKYRYKN